MSHASPETLYFMRYCHPEKNTFKTPEAAGLDDDQLCATLFGMPKEKYLELKQQYVNIVRRAAADLLNDPNFAALVDRLPFRPGDTVVGLGDSITDDSQSWVELLRHVLDMRRPSDQIKVHNMGISGDTTTQMVSRFTGVSNLDPDWIICMAGTNDARLHGLQPVKPLVSIEETRKNLAFLSHLGKTQTKAQWVWITPTPIIRAKVELDAWFVSNQIRWTVEEVNDVAEAVRSQPGMVVDLHPSFGNPPDPKLLISDGLHPSLEGQKVILRRLVEKLTIE